MKIDFVAPILHELDAVEHEALCGFVWQDARPCDGVAALCDWRMCGRLSLLMRRGQLTGALGEVVLIPGRPRLPFEKILLFGAGPRATFEQALLGELLGRALTTILDLGCKSVALQLPGRGWGPASQRTGRAADRILPERAVDCFLELVAAASARHLSVALVESGEPRRRIEQQLAEQGRRLREVP